MTGDNGGAVFPQLERSYVNLDSETIYESSGGMSLRDYFAAMERSQPPNDFSDDFASKVVGDSVGGRRPLTGLEIAALCSAWRYACADTMLAQRSKAGDA